MPGGRLKPDPRDLYALGAHQGGFDERWFASPTNADNGSGIPEDGGLSYMALNGKRIRLKEAIETPGHQFFGTEIMPEQSDWTFLCKSFDKPGPIPHHVHHPGAC